MNHVTRLAHRLGISPLMRGLKRDVLRHGWKLRFRWNAVEIDDGKHLLIFPVDDPYILVKTCRYKTTLFDRMIFRQINGREVVDYREEQKFRLRSGDIITIPCAPETCDPLEGYIAQGPPRPGEIVLDCGAFCGEYTIEFSRMVGPEGHVYALEPDPVNRELINRNVSLTQVTNVTVLPYALWSSSGAIAFNAEGNCGSGVQSVSNDQSKVDSSVMVEGKSADEIFDLMGTTPDFIKMDIEGAEVEVLSAMIPLLRKSPKPCRLAIASYHVRDGRPTHEIITPDLQAAGFEVETGYPAHPTTWAWNG